MEKGYVYILLKDNKTNKQTGIYEKLCFVLSFLEKVLVAYTHPKKIKKKISAATFFMHYVGNITTDKTDGNSASLMLGPAQRQGLQSSVKY